MTAIVLFSLTFLLMGQSLVGIIQGTDTGTGIGGGTALGGGILGIEGNVGYGGINSGGVAGSSQGGGVATGGAGVANSGGSQTCPSGLHLKWRTCWGPCLDNCPTGSVNTQCASVCLNDCYCEDNFKSNTKGECIPQNKCNVCPKSNEEWTLCGNECTDDCQILCPKICNTGCFCKFGYKRVNGDCVPNLCPTRTCVAGQEYRYGNECLENCLKPKKDCPKTIELTCHCRRRSGTKWNPYNLQCVRPNQCPRRNRNNNN